MKIKPTIKRFVIEIDPALHQQIKIKATTEGKTLKAKATELFINWLKKG